MGICLSADDASKEEAARSKALDKQLKEESKEGTSLKLLLLGPGESGKSTIFKQIQLIHQSGFGAEERAASKKLVQRNILQSIKALLHAAGTMDIQLEEPHRPAADRVQNAPQTVWSADLGEDCKALWGDQAIQKAYQRRAEFQLSDSTS